MEEELLKSKKERKQSWILKEKSQNRVYRNRENDRKKMEKERKITEKEKISQNSCELLFF